MTALHEADADLASLVPEAGKSKVAASNPHHLSGSYSTSQWLLGVQKGHTGHSLSCR